MKALTLTQPFATLIAIGQKRIETRGWRTNYTGPIAIHAAANWKARDRQLLREAPFTEVLEVGGYLMRGPRGGVSTSLPFGAVVAFAYLLVVERCHGGIPGRWLAPTLGSWPGAAPWESAFGDYRYPRYGFILGDVQALPEPIPARGALMLWDWEPSDPKHIEMIAAYRARHP